MVSINITFKIFLEVIIINNQVNFFSVLASNFKCAFCSRRNCSVRYYPRRRKTSYINGTKYTKTCHKDQRRALRRCFRKK